MRQSRRHSSPVGSWALRLGHKSESSSGVVVPSEIEEGLHAWLHPDCWPKWHGRRRAEGARAIHFEEQSLKS
jgi:hypothetical protein